MDPIASVRQGGAASLAVLVTHNTDLFESVVSKMKIHFGELKTQKESTKKFGSLEPGPGAFGVIRRVKQGEDEMENNTMYSCGSLGIG